MIIKPIECEKHETKSKSLVPDHHSTTNFNLFRAIKNTLGVRKRSEPRHEKEGSENKF